jgi:hypothetical protein
MPQQSRATSFWNPRAQTLWQASCSPQGAVGATEKSFSAESLKRTEQAKPACFFHFPRHLTGV